MEDSVRKKNKEEEKKTFLYLTATEKEGSIPKLEIIKSSIGKKLPEARLINPLQLFYAIPV